MAVPDFRPPPPGETAGDAVSRKNAPERSRGTRRHTCALFSGLALLFFLFSVRFGTILTSFWSPWDLKNLAFSSRMSSNSSFSLFSPRTPPESTKIIEKGPPSTPKGITEEPRSAQKLPGRAPRASQNHPQSALRAPLGVQKVSWGGFGGLRASFWSPQGRF